VAQNKGLRGDFESTCSSKVEATKSGRPKEIKVSADFYLKNLLLVLLQPQIDGAQLKRFATQANLLGFKKDLLKMQRLLHTLSILIKHKEMIGTALPSVLERLFKGDEKEIVSQCIALQGLLELNGESLLHDKESSFEDLLLPALVRVVPLGEIDDFMTKFANLRANFRGFTSIATYAGKLNSLPDKDELLDQYGRFIKAVLENNFIEVRQSIKNNPHLTYLEEHCPVILREWHSHMSEKEVEALLGASAEVTIRPKEISYRDQLKEKLVNHQHLSSDKIPDLIAYLQGSGTSEAVRNTLKVTSPYKEIQILCVDLIEGDNKKETLEKLEKALDSIGDEGVNFKNDISGFLRGLSQRENSYKGLKISFTNDPNDYFLCGTEVNGSCQSVIGEARFNQCLLSYLLDGKNRLVTVNDPEGKIIARSVIRLLWDDRVNKPVLFQEQAYSSRLDPKLDDLLYKEAKEMAKTLHIPYASFQERPKNTLYSLGGPVPYEYSDAADRSHGAGIYEKGRYYISPVYEDY
jgi:hypothetical protein